MTYEFHAACLLMPRMQVEEYTALCESIRQGYAPGHPILLCDGKILDGRHRYQACLDTGTEPIFVEWSGGDPFLFVDREHAARRHWISQEQEGAVRKKLFAKSNEWAEMQTRINEEGNRARSEAMVGNQNWAAEKTVDPQVEGQLSGSVRNHAIKHARSSATAMAKILGISRAAMERVHSLEQNAPDLLDKVAAGDIPAGLAIKEMRRELGKARMNVRIARLNAISASNHELNAGKKYRVIYADPPWRYEHARTENRAIENKYPTMTLDEIKALPICQISEDDSIIFLWATSPKLVEAMEVLTTWGFTYRTMAVWDKEIMGMGYYFRQQHEVLLVATRGDMPAPPPDARPVSVVIEKRGNHSTKPEIFRKYIEAMYPAFDRVELFCREPAKGWDVWGNQSAGE